VRRFLILLAAAVAVSAAGCSGEEPAATPTSAVPTVAASPSTSSPAASGPLTLGLPADASAAAAQAGLPMLGAEELAVHYHAHLDVIVDGSAVTVPAGIGIDEQRHMIAPLHTHQPDGIVHIESATDVPFTLGQLFTAWGHPISATSIGAFPVPQGEQLRVYRNGTLQTGDPAKIVFKAHDEIVVWVGPADAKPTIPADYAFPSGY
jgi:hypothetical protein